MENQNALRDKIVSCICTMDMRMLDVLLPDHGMHESTYKEVWLERLNSFFTFCKLGGDAVLTVQRKACSVGIQCNCGQVIWLFDAEKSRKGFAIYFEMDGHEIKGIGRCYGHEDDGQDVRMINEAFEYEAFYIYDHEKIGFVDSQEYKALRKDVKLFIKDMTNPRRHTFGLIGLKRKLVDYNKLYFDVNEVPYLFEYKMEMLKLYEDWFAIKNVFSQRKGFQQVIEKSNELMQCSEPKGKVKVMRWFLRNEFKVKNFMVFHSALQIEPYRIIYPYQIDGVSRRLIIRHPKIQMDVDACSFLMTYVKQFYIYLFDRYLTDLTIYEYMESKCAMYHHFKDRMDEVVGAFDDRWGVNEFNH
jgi:hypothetical protein